MSAKSFELYGTRKRFGNVDVERTADGISVYLWGNRVFKLNALNSTITISSCGWQTPTTKTAINNALDQAGIKGGIYQKNYRWFYHWGNDWNDANKHIPMRGELVLNMWTGEPVLQAVA